MLMLVALCVLLNLEQAWKYLGLKQEDGSRSGLGSSIFGGRCSSGLGSCLPTWYRRRDRRWLILQLPFDV